ncbi:MAG: hypothetical protein JWL76_407 [Thermoleophilia bacterium]|nr:hypothetical protein [Thermoleophilia bacterium]
MSYVSWTVAAVLALAALIVFLFVPGLAVLAALLFGVAVVFGILLLIGRGGSVGAGTTPDIIERRNESEARRRDRGMR